MVDVNDREARRTVGQVATLVGVSVRTLHHYDEIALVTPSARSRVGYRSYSDADVNVYTRFCCTASSASRSRRSRPSSTTRPSTHWRTCGVSARYSTSGSTVCTEWSQQSRK